MRILILIAGFSFLFFSHALQAQKDIEKTSKTKRPAQNIAKPPTAERDTVDPDGYLLKPASDRYRRQIQKTYNLLSSTYGKNFSGELRFYTDLDFTKTCWYKPEVRLKNRPEELQKFIQLMRTLDALCKKRALTDDDRRAIMNYSQAIKQMRDQIRPVMPDGNPAPCAHTIAVAAAVKITVRVVNSKNVTQNNVKVYAVRSARQNACGCPECFAGTNYGDCDLNVLRQNDPPANPTVFPVLGQTTVPKGSYFLFVTRPAGGAEPIIYRVAKSINADSAVKITLPN